MKNSAMKDRKKQMRDGVKKTWLDASDQMQVNVVRQLLNPQSTIKNFESRTGLAGLSQNYNMPFGRPKELIEIDFEIVRHLSRVVYKDKRFGFMPSATARERQAYHNHTGWLIREFRRLNPELRTIDVNPGSVDQSFDFIVGVTTSYAPEDIAYYLSKTWDQSHWLKTPHIAALQGRLTRHFGERCIIGVVASPETCQKVHAQLDKMFAPE